MLQLIVLVGKQVSLTDQVSLQPTRPEVHARFYILDGRTSTGDRYKSRLMFWVGNKVLPTGQASGTYPASYLGRKTDSGGRYITRFIFSRGNKVPTTGQASGIHCNQYFW